MLSRATAEAVLAEALSTGGDFAEIFMEDTLSGNISMIDGNVDSALNSRDHGAGIRIYHGLNAVYVHTNDTTLEGLMSCARKAAAAVGVERLSRQVQLTRSIPTNLHPIKLLPGDVSGQRKVRKLMDAYRTAKAYDNSISQVITSLRDVDQSVVIANSDGLFIEDRRVYTRMSVKAVASGGGENQTGSIGPGAMMGFELFDTRVDPAALGKEAARTAVTMLRAPVCPAGTMPVAIDGGFGGVIFHEACGHSLEATSVARGNSEFSGRLGQKIASDCVTAIDDGTMPNEWGSTNIDDEGTPTNRLVLIENGVLKNYMIDRLNSRRMNMPVTGSARRQSYAYAPTSRMRNTYIAPGDSDPDEIISTMGDGLYAAKMGGGSVNPATGEFNFAVMEGYLVKDGKIDTPVRGATLVGKGSEIILKIDRVGRDMTMSQGMCGSASGSVPVNVGQPMIRVSSMTVGGGR
ncbi:MAG: TldD/PmbA family protein [Candidatus Fimadaptatus sp.]|jgi:TldD protein